MILESDMPLDALIDGARSAEQSGSWDDALSQYRAAADRIRAGEQPERGPRVIRWIGRVLFERGDYDQAKAAFEASLVRAQELGAREDAAGALNALAVVEQFRGRLDVAEAFYTRAGALADEVGDLRLGAMIHQNLGTLANVRGDLGTALARYQDALDRFKKLGDDRASAWVLNNMGMLHTDVKENAAAELCFKSAITLAERLKDDSTRAKVEGNRAELYIARRDWRRARDCCQRALQIFGQLGSESGLGGVYRIMGVLHRMTGNPQLAHAQLDLALELARVCENPLLEAETENERAHLHLDQRRPNQALRSLNRAQELFRTLDARREILDLERRLERLEPIYVRAAELAMEDAPSGNGPVGGQRRKRVTDLAMELARAVGSDDLIWIKVAAALRDLGTRTPTRRSSGFGGSGGFGNPSGLGGLSGAVGGWDDDMPASKPAGYAETLARDLGFPDPVCGMVRGQHERWDGSGQPDGLAGEAIPLGSRILSIADVFDALTAGSSHGPTRSPSEALEVMRTEMAGTFDPQLLDRFGELVG